MPGPIGPQGPVAKPWASARLADLKARNEASQDAGHRLQTALARVNPGMALAVRMELMAQLHGSHLSLTGASAELVQCVQQMESDGWAALQDCARQRNGVGITSIDLSSRIVMTAELGANMKELGTLERFSYPALRRRAPEYASLLQQPAAQAEPVIMHTEQPPPSHEALMGILEGTAVSGSVDEIQICVSTLITNSADAQLQRWIADELSAGHQAPVQGFVRAVAMALPGPEHRERRLNLLSVGPLVGQIRFIPQLSAFVEEPADGEPAGGEVGGPQHWAAPPVRAPLLHHVCGELEPLSGNQIVLVAQYDTIRAFTGEVMNSGFPDDETQQILAPLYGAEASEMTPAASATRAGHAGAAAAICIGIYEANVAPATKSAHITALGVDVAGLSGELEELAMQEQEWAKDLSARLGENAEALRLLEGSRHWTMPANGVPLLAQDMIISDTTDILFSSAGELPSLSKYMVPNRPCWYAVPVLKLAGVGLVQMPELDSKTAEPG